MSNPNREPDRFALTVLLAYVETPEHRWQNGRWEITGVAAGDSGGGKRLIREQGPVRYYLWPGFSLRLYSDQGESYYYNLLADNPQVYVVCRRDDDGSLRPVLTTLSYDEAASYTEGDDEVHPVAMPAEVYRWVESFVLTHYVPEQRLRRERDDWKKSAHPES